MDHQITAPHHHARDNVPPCHSYPTDHRGLALVVALAGQQLEEFVAWLVTSGSVVNLESAIAQHVGTDPIWGDREAPREV